MEVDVLGCSDAPASPPPPVSPLQLAACRRSRSDSVSDDYATVKTNDEATEAKLAAVRLGSHRMIDRRTWSCSHFTGLRLFSTLFGVSNQKSGFCILSLSYWSYSIYDYILASVFLITE